MNQRKSVPEAANAAGALFVFFCRCPAVVCMGIAEFGNFVYKGESWCEGGVSGEAKAGFCAMVNIFGEADGAA
ncbi:hypothetical protein [Paenibacillus methanolicus]|uniref:hypothetical protein n=1 Tax=Paenibacillus methanolicus TaxID=582686 RepID=UPI0011E77177|nr:hypothetical protein [Paenibacillus methanolicus]